MTFRKLFSRIPYEEIEDALFAMAHALHPDTPAGQPHALYDALYSAAESYLHEHDFRDALTPDEEAAHIERAVKAMVDGDRSGYRQALRGWVEAARGGSSPAS